MLPDFSGLILLGVLGFVTLLLGCSAAVGFLGGAAVAWLGGGFWWGAVPAGALPAGLLIWAGVSK